ncbi:MAG TPA: outer membrane protein assembly factor BamA [Bryocella sp.]|nr:outer membrane protein assembly factor BamA [Bryocella sp.]
MRTPITSWLCNLAIGLTLLAPVANAQLPSGATPAASPSESLSKYEGKTVSAIRFRGIIGADSNLLRSLIVQKTGQPLDREKLRASLDALYATGRFATLDAEAEPGPDNTLSLVFVVTENYFNGAVSVDGAPQKGNPKPHQLIAASQLDLGDLFSEEKVVTSIDRMKKIMADNGYYEAAIRYNLQPNPDDRQMAIHFLVTPGVLAKVGEVNIKGDAGIAPDQVQKLTKLKAGANVSSDKVARALDRMRKYYQKNQHLEAEVSLVARQYHPETNRLDYIFEVNEGPTVSITTEGDSVSKSELKKLVPVYQENSVDDDLLNEGRRNLRDYLQTRGYFDATVDVERHAVPDGNHLNIVYVVDPGIRHKLAVVKVEGNKYFDTETIRERMQVEPSSFVMPSGKFSQRLLSEDVNSIRYLYLANGFLDAKVETDLREDYQGKKNEMEVLIKIDEGPQTLVNGVQIEGADSADEKQLEPKLRIVHGQPFSEVDIADDRDAVTYYYYNRGYPNVEFESSTTPAPGEANRMDVVYKITEGQRVFVNRVIITGISYTRPYVVNRQMRIADGDPLSQTRMVDSQRRLYNLGLFNEVDMAVQNPEGQEPSKDVLFNIQEAKRWTFRYGGGFEFATGNLPSTTNPQGKTGVSPNGVLEITRLNLFGRDQTFTFRGRLGLLTRRGIASYDAPRLFHRENWRIVFSALYDNTADVNTFAASRLEGSVQAEQKVNRFLTVAYGLSFQRVEVDKDSLVIDPVLIALYSQPVFIAMPTITMVRDRRDDGINPTKGSYNAFNGGVATSALGSQTNFGRALVENSTYYTFKKKWVLARRTQIGIEKPFGTNNFLDLSSLPPGAIPAEATQIPLPELFFAGGSNSLRSFSINEAGPRDTVTGFAIGGQGLFVNNIEVRTPPVALPYVGNNLGFVFFHDMGNVFDTANHILDGLTTFHQPSIADCSLSTDKMPCNFNYNSQAVGTGIRYKTPVGPVRFDLGYALNPTRFPIQEHSQTDSLRRINVFFSIGQTF